EPFLPLRLQSRLWSAVYLLLLLLVGVCALLLWRTRSAQIAGIPSAEEPAATNEDKALSFKRRGRWILLAFVPSSLMLGVTNYITVDIASAPLLWIIPLALYLLSLIFAFAQRQIFSLRWTMLIIPGATLVLLLVHLLESSDGARMLILFHLLYFFVVAFVCHRQLAADRPRTTHLSEFYVWFSVGGVVGGIFNALI